MGWALTKWCLTCFKMFMYSAVYAIIYSSRHQAVDDIFELLKIRFFDRHKTHQNPSSGGRSVGSLGLVDQALPPLWHPRCVPRRGKRAGHGAGRLVRGRRAKRRWAAFAANGASEIRHIEPGMSKQCCTNPSSESEVFSLSGGG